MPRLAHAASVGLVPLLLHCEDQARVASRAPEVPLEEPEPVVAGEEGEDPAEASLGAPPKAGSAGSALLAEVDRELAQMKRSTYAHHTHVDESQGTYEYDCSGFLGYVLARSVPDAWSALVATTPRRPRSVEIVNFLLRIPVGGTSGRWQHLARIEDLAPGDVVVWRKPADSLSTNTGHTVIVYGPVVADALRPGAFLVPVADSTEHLHVPGDSRSAAQRTGLGQGEIVLVGDASGAPVAYRWSRGTKSREKSTTIALGRLR
jgi:hypothetical protein